MNFIQQYQTEITTLCIKHKVKELYAFGSVLDAKKFNENSDVDVIVKFDDKVVVEDYANLFFDFADNLEVLFKRKVDLMISKPIKNRFLRANIESTKQLVYAA